MTNFSYIADNKAGKIKRGSISSTDCEQVRKILAGKGWDLVSCQEEKSASFLHLDIGNLFGLLFHHKISDLDKISFSHHLAVMLKAGVPIIEAVEVLGTDVTSPKFGKIIAQLRSNLEAGKPLSSLLEEEKIFSKAHLAILKSGEASGKVEEALTIISADLKRDYQIKKKVKGAMAYPTIVTLALFGISGFIIVFVLPKVGDVFKRMNLDIPLPTRILLALGLFISQRYLEILVVLVVLVPLLFFLFKATNVGSKIIPKIVPFIPFVKKVIKQMSMARFVRSLSSLLSSGVPIAEALRLSSEVFISSHYQKIFKEVVVKVEKGTSLTNSLRTYKKSFEGILIKMCAVGEKSGNLEDILEELALFYEAEVDEKLETVSTIVEPVLMLFVGLGVGGVILSIIGPIYQMIGSFTP